MQGSTIVFDLDGTLVDTAPDLVDTLNVILAREGLPAVPYPHARMLVGHGARHMIDQALATAGETGRDVDRMLADFLAHYADHIADRSRAFPGVEAALDALAARGCSFAVCTNKREALSVKLLEQLGLARRFAAICGQDTFAVQKPDAEALRGTLRRAGGHPERAVMVGDSHTDIATARAAAVPVVAVDFGYTPTPVAAFCPDHVISHYDALPAAVERLLAVRSNSRSGHASARIPGHQGG
jgi:phosphoglycolate phosphatase